MKITKKSLRALLTRASFAGLLLVGGASIANAQTNGTLTPLTTTYNWSTAPWVPGPYPDGGGTATFNSNLGATPGTVAGTTTITMNVSPTLSQITYNTPFSIVLAASGTNTIVAASTGLTLNATLTPANTPTLFQLPNTISVPISGGGSVGLIKTGVGTVTLTGANTYTGGTQINGGILAVSSTAAVGDGVFGAAGTAITFNGGALFANTTGGLTTTRNIVLGANGGTIYTNTATTLGGVISGGGSLTNAGFAAVALNLTAANTYTGATIGAQNVSNFTLSGNGSIATSSSYDLTGSLTLTNTGTNVLDRLSDTAPMTVRGLNFVSTGFATAASSETIGAVTSASSLNSFLVTPGASAGNSLTMASLTRQNNSTVILRGTGLGNTPGSGVANIYATTAPALTGGGGGAGTTAISILPYAIGNNTSSVATTAAGLVSSGFVTYGANGFRTLDPTTEYAAAFGVSNLDNVRLTAATAAPANATANAVLFAPAAAATLSGGTINITSGAFMYSPTVDSTGTVSAALNFGTAEGIISNTSLLTLSGPISGSGGVTYTSAVAGTPSTATIALSGTSTYTGNTTLNSGSLGFSGTVAATGNASVFGNSGTIVLSGGVNSASLAATAAATLNRDISSVGTGINYIANGSGFTFTLNGNISLTNSLYIYGNSNAAASAITFAGNITGTGGIVDTTFGYDVFTGNNSFSGGVTLPASSTFVAGSDTAFGTGTIYVTGTGTLQGLGTAARTLANQLFLSATPTIGGTAPLTFTGGTNLNGARSMAISNTALTTFGGTISNGAFTKTGTGAIALNSATGNTFTGGFVNSGSAANSTAIYANNTSGSAFGTGAVNVGGASATVYSTLSGSFTTSGAASIGGRLSPGYTPGNLLATTAGQGVIGTEAFGSSLLMSSSTTSSLYLEAASNVSNDQIKVGGLFTLAGTVNIATIGGYVFQPGDVVDFVDWGSISVGTFTINTSAASVAPGYALDTSFFTTDGTIRVTAVPEPGTWAAVVGGLGVLGSLQYVRRRNRRA